eukprot:4238908-Alexandrium_andersonii.AAC.1
MSASLVGSEMCIRDSLRSAGSLSPFRCGFSHLHQPVESACKRWNNHLPVSYTHLTLPTICSV